MGPTTLRTDPLPRQRRCRRLWPPLPHGYLRKAAKGSLLVFGHAPQARHVCLPSATSCRLDATARDRVCGCEALRYKHDLSLPKVRQSYLNRIAAKEFDAVLLSPPCATFSRAAWANFRGPRPVRSYECPRGLQTLTPAERDRAIMGNIFADFSYEVAALVTDQLPSLLWNNPRTWVR